MQIKDASKILEVIKNDCFVKEYGASDQEAMGLLVSKYFEWDGIRILEACFEALEDANFHSEAMVINELLEKNKQLLTK